MEKILNNKKLYKDWEIIHKEKVVDTVVNGGIFADTHIYFKLEYIIRNKKTGELKRI